MDDFQLDTALGRVRVRIRGSGEAMIFWPSLLMTGDMWAAQADHFGRDHQVILVDPPGHGGSQKLTAPFSFDDAASSTSSTASVSRERISSAIPGAG